MLALRHTVVLAFLVCVGSAAHTESHAKSSPHAVTTSNLVGLLEWAGQTEREQVRRSLLPRAYEPPPIPSGPSVQQAQPSYHVPSSPSGPPMPGVIGRPLQHTATTMPRFLQTLMPPAQPTPDPSTEAWLPVPHRPTPAAQSPSPSVASSSQPQAQARLPRFRQQQGGRGGVGNSNGQQDVGQSVAANGPTDEGARYFYTVADPAYIQHNYPTAGTRGEKPRDLQTPVVFLAIDEHERKQCEDLSALLNAYKQQKDDKSAAIVSHLNKALTECRGDASITLPSNNAAKGDCDAINAAIQAAESTGNRTDASDSHKQKWSSIRSHLAQAHTACREDVPRPESKSESTAPTKPKPTEPAKPAKKVAVSSTVPTKPCSHYQHGYLKQDATLSTLNGYRSVTQRAASKRRQWYGRWLRCRKGESARAKRLEECAKLEVQYKGKAVKARKLRAEINELARNGRAGQLKHTQRKLKRTESQRYTAYNGWLACVKRHKQRTDCSAARTKYRQWAARYQRATLRDKNNLRAKIKAENLRDMNKRLWDMCKRHKSQEQAHQQCRKLNHAYRQAHAKLKAFRKSMTAEKKRLEQPENSAELKEKTAQLGALVKAQYSAFSAWTQCQQRLTARMNKDVGGAAAGALLEAHAVLTTRNNPVNRLPQTANDAGGPDPAVGAQSQSSSDGSEEPEWIVPPLPEGFQNRLGPSQSISLGPGTVPDQQARKQDPVTGALYPHQDLRPEAGHLPDAKANVDAALQSAQQANPAGVTAQHVFLQMAQREQPPPLGPTYILAPLSPYTARGESDPSHFQAKPPAPSPFPVQPATTEVTGQEVNGMPGEQVAGMKLA